jgi:hypothetical protein
MQNPTPNVFKCSRQRTSAVGAADGDISVPVALFITPGQVASTAQSSANELQSDRCFTGAAGTKAGHAIAMR